jgi:hypothetical protein
LPTQRLAATIGRGGSRITPFEFIFPLFGLLIGLSYAEILGGLARALKAPGDVRIGWLTPLLGAMLLINLTMFWFASWQFRDAELPTREGLLQMLAMSGSYYLAAAMLFPSTVTEGQDLDDHLMDNKRIALLAIAACNLFGLSIYARQRDWAVGPDWWVINGIFLAILVATAFARSKRIVLAGLLMLIGAHVAALFAG